MTYWKISIYQILHTSIIIKNGESVVKSGKFEKPLQWKARIFLIKEGCQIFCVKMLLFP